MSDKLHAVVATPDLVIYPFSGSASVAGDLAAGTTEEALVTGAHELLVVENPWLKVVSELPDPIYRPRYGT